MFTRLLLITAVIGSLALSPAAAQVEPVANCAVVIQFYNEGLPGAHQISSDSRWGIRLNVPDVGYVLVPADNNGFVRFYVTPGTMVPYQFVPLYMDPLSEDSGVDGESGCGFTAIHVAAGT